MTTCAYPGCSKKVTARGLCGRHYQQQRAGKILVPLALPLDSRAKPSEWRCRRCGATLSDGRARHCQPCVRAIAIEAEQEKHAKKQQKRELDAFILQMHENGFTYEQIGRHLGASKQQVHRLLQAADALAAAESAGCRVRGCVDTPVAHQLCQRHYTRHRRGLPLVDEPLDPPAYGLLGHLDDDGETVMCHICGERKKSLGLHIRKAHNIDPQAYKQRYGLPLSKGLLPQAMTERASALARERVGTPAWRRMEAKRDPIAASQSRGAESFKSKAVRDASARQASLVSDSNTRGAYTLCRDCGAHVPRVIGRHPRTLCDECVERQRSENARRQHAAKYLQNDERDRRIVKLWRQGMNKSAIGREVGISNVMVLNVLRSRGVVE